MRIYYHNSGAPRGSQNMEHDMETGVIGIFIGITTNDELLDSLQ